ncbi:MAG TPA: hypothetical protein VEP67_10260 [Thiobacillaceae bacterium]|nr:hypothetical protein [Thiobacillaceae bacterium]
MKTVVTVEYFEKAFGWLQEHHIPSAFTANSCIQQTTRLASSSAENFVQFIYGSFFGDVPHDYAHEQQGEFLIHKKRFDHTIGRGPFIFPHDGPIRHAI